MYCKEGNSFQFSFLALLSSFELGIGHMGLTILQSYKEGCFALSRANTRSVMNESRWLRHTLQAPLFSTLASTSPVFFFISQLLLHAPLSSLQHYNFE